MIITNVKSFIFKKIIIIVISFLFYLNTSSFLIADSDNIEPKLIERREILQFDLKNKIYNNKNVNFNNLMTIEIDLKPLIVNCFFGYQEDKRIVLCY